MNNILNEIKQLIDESMKEYLPNVKYSDLEGNGNIYYMNGKNGTEFDWHVNDRISDFMMFYNDEKNLGAVKSALYKDGTVVIYIYGDKGNKLVKEIQTLCKASEKEILNLAVILKNEADDKKLFGAGIDKINTDTELSRDKISDFIGNRKYYETAINRKKLFNLRAYVSKKITEEGWKVGYMVKSEPYNEWDSGWQFLAGNEDDKYLSDPNNTALLSIGVVCQLDRDILKYLDSPVGAQFIRISSNEFETDKHNKAIYLEKR